MGTHPIFESDFDCLTDMSRVRYAGLQFWQIRKASSRIQRSELVEYANKMITRRSSFDNKVREILQERSETDFLRNETEDPFAEVLHRGKRNLKKLVTELVSFEFRSIELNIERLLYKDLRNEFTFAIDTELADKREGAFSVRDLGNGNYEIMQHIVYLKPYFNHSEELRNYLKKYLPSNMDRLNGIHFAENRDRYALTVTQKFTHEGKPIGRAKILYSVIRLDLGLSYREMGYILQNSKKFLGSDDTTIQMESNYKISLHEYETHYLNRADRLSKIPKILEIFKFMAPKLENLSKRLIESTYTCMPEYNYQNKHGVAVSHLDPVQRYIFQFDPLSKPLLPVREPEFVAIKFESALSYHMQFPVARFIAEEATHVNLIELENNHVIFPWRMMKTEDDDVKLLAGIDAKISTPMRKKHSCILHEVIYDILYDPNTRITERLLRHRSQQLVSLYHNKKYDDFDDENYQQ